MQIIWRMTEITIIISIDISNNPLDRRGVNLLDMAAILHSGSKARQIVVAVA